MIKQGKWLSRVYSFFIKCHFFVSCEKINLFASCRKFVIETDKSLGIMGTMAVTEIDKSQPVTGKLNDLLRLLSPDFLTRKVRCILALPI